MKQNRFQRQTSDTLKHTSASPKGIDLLHGAIFPSLTALAVPFMLTSLVQMAYNLIDMIWIGRLSSDAVASVGAAGMYTWLSSGLAILARMGAQVLAAQSLGADNPGEASEYCRAALQMGLFFAAVYGLASVIFRYPLIGFLKLNSPQVSADARAYLCIACGLIVFTFMNQILTGLLAAQGDSTSSFLATAAGLLLNLVLDPVLIFGIGPFPVLGVAGAAIATVFAQALVTLFFLLIIRKNPGILGGLRLFAAPDLKKCRAIVRIGLPASVQSMAFTGISMVISRLIAGWGDTAIAVQKVGSQIESISWMTADGFAMAVNSFTAQNYGAGNEERIRKGYLTSMAVAFIWGTFCTLALVLLPGPIFSLFIPDASVRPLGIDYLRILGYSQLFMCMEITTAGAFNGLGQTRIPSFVSTLFTSARIPLALFLSATALGLSGIWWSISISSIFKGVILVTWFLLLRKRRGNADGSGVSGKKSE